PLLLSPSYAAPPHPHSFPTRRSSDLGNANFNTPLTNNNADFTYNFTGTLTNCMSNASGAPSDGMVSAGTIITIPGVKGKFQEPIDRKSTRLNSSHSQISYAVFCLKKK